VTDAVRASNDVHRRGLPASVTMGFERPELRTAAALQTTCTEVDRVAPFSGHVVDVWSPTWTYVSLMVDGELVGLLIQPGGDPAELAVRPDFRGRGLGGAVLDQLLAGPAPAVWAHGSLPAAAGLAASRGLVVVRELLQMRRHLDDLPAAELPPGVSLRAFRPGDDEDAFLAVNARAFAWHPEQGRMDRTALAAEMAQPWFDPAGFLLAVGEDGRLLGYHWTKVHDIDPTPAGNEPRPLGEVYVLGVDPQSPVRRLGTPLTLAGLRYLRDRGLDQVTLYVEADNGSALKLYERLGFRRYLTDVVYARPSGSAGSGAAAGGGDPHPRP
jgi:mycothiol synthase